MSLLTMAQNIANETGYPEPAAIIGSTDITNRRLLASINGAGRWMRKFHDWVILQTIYEFTTVTDQQSYPLPSDYDRLIERTIWDQTGTRAYGGPLSPQEWQSIKSGGIPDAGITPSFRILPTNNKKAFYVTPTPASTGDTQVFEYISRNWVILDDNDVPTDRFGKSGDVASDADTTLFEEDDIEVISIPRFLRLNGLPFVSALNEAENIILNSIGSDGGSKPINMAPNVLLPPHLAAVTPDTGFGS